MARDHGKALDIEHKIDELHQQIQALEKEQLEYDPALSEQSKIKRQTVSVHDIAMLTSIEGGRIADEFKYQMTRLLKDIQDHPFRMAANGSPKAEKRSISICMDVTPVVTIDKVTSRPLTKDMAFHVKVTSSLPKYQSAGSTALIEQTHDGIIRDVRINPNNPENPRQLEFELDDDEG